MKGGNWGMRQEKQLTGKAIQTKIKIIEAAKELFVEYGYAGTTLREVAKKANVTTGAFYKYFKSKDEILILIFNDGFKEQWKHFYDLGDDFIPRDYIEMDARMNKGIAETFGHEMLKIYFSALWTMDDKESLWKVMDDDSYNDQDYRLIARMVEKYSIDYSVEQVDDIILTIERGIFFQWILKKGEFNIEEATKQLLTLALKGVFTKCIEW